MTQQNFPFSNFNGPFYHPLWASSLLPFASCLLSFLQNEPNLVRRGYVTQRNPVRSRGTTLAVGQQNEPNFIDFNVKMQMSMKNKPNLVRCGYIELRHLMRPRGTKPDCVRRNEANFSHRGYVTPRNPMRSRGTSLAVGQRNEANFLRRGYVECCNPVSMCGITVAVSHSGRWPANSSCQVGQICL